MANELNILRCGTRNMFGFAGDIPSQGGQPTFIAIYTKAHVPNYRNSSFTAFHMKVSMPSFNGA